MKFYKITEDRYLMTDGEMVCEVNKDVVLKSTSTSKIKRFILIGEKYYKSIQLLSKKGIKTDYADPEKLEYIIEDDVIKVNDKEYSFEVSKEDAGSTVVFIKSGYSKAELAYLFNEFEKIGVLVINNANSVSDTSNKWITYEMLEKNDIPQPSSVLINSNDVSKKDHDGLYKKLKNIYNKPQDDDRYVCKLLKGHGGRGVFVCRHKNILSILQCIFAVKNNTEVMVQKCLDLKDGDIRANVLTINKKQKLINAVKRTKGNDKDFRTNLSLGGHAEEIELTKEQQQMAFNVAKLSGLTWAGVDIIEDTAGNMYVIEINGAPGTPYDVENQEDLLDKNTKFYANLVDLINEMI